MGTYAKQTHVLRFSLQNKMKRLVERPQYQSHVVGFFLKTRHSIPHPKSSSSGSVPAVGLQGKTQLSCWNTGFQDVHRVPVDVHDVGRQHNSQVAHVHLVAGGVRGQAWQKAHGETQCAQVFHGQQQTQQQRAFHLRHHPSHEHNRRKHTHTVVVVEGQGGSRGLQLLQVILF